MLLYTNLKPCFRILGRQTVGFLANTSFSTISVLFLFLVGLCDVVWSDGLEGEVGGVGTATAAGGLNTSMSTLFTYVDFLFL